MADEAHFDSPEEKDRLVAELGEAHVNVAAANSALIAVIKALGDTRRVLKDYTRYFRVAVAVGIISIIFALTAGWQQYQVNQKLEHNQEAIAFETEERVYTDCIRVNDSRSNIIETFALLGEGFIRDTPESRETLARFLKALEEKFPQIDCGPKPISD